MERANLKRSAKKKEVLVLTGSRGEYGYISPILKLTQDHPRLKHRILATNMHLLPEFGDTIGLFEKDGFRVDHKIEMTLAGFTNVSMTKSLGVFMLSLTDIVANSPPDIILLAGDRGEQLVGAIVGAHLNIPTAHIQAGEISGNIDGLTRHAITKFAHIHFPSNSDAATRLEKMGEQPFRIHLVGAPQLDEFMSLPLVSRDKIFEKYNLDLSKPYILCVQHPVTEQALQARRQMEITLEAITELKIQTILIFPNNDAGSTGIQTAIEKHRSPLIRVLRNVERDLYGGFMKHAGVIVGNSSSALLEAPSFALPAVNIGRRQEGRLAAINVINVAHDVVEIRLAIEKAISPEFAEPLREMSNPYGDGRSSERIVNILDKLEINEKLLYKKLTY